MVVLEGKADIALQSGSNAGKDRQVQSEMPGPQRQNIGHSGAMIPLHIGGNGMQALQRVHGLFHGASWPNQRQVPLYLPLSTGQAACGRLAQKLRPVGTLV